MIVAHKMALDPHNGKAIYFRKSAAQPGFPTIGLSRNGTSRMLPGTPILRYRSRLRSGCGVNATINLQHAAASSVRGSSPVCA